MDGRWDQFPLSELGLTVDSYATDALKEAGILTVGQYLQKAKSGEIINGLSSGDLRIITRCCEDFRDTAGKESRKVPERPKAAPPAAPKAGAEVDPFRAFFDSQLGPVVRVADAVVRAAEHRVQQLGGRTAEELERCPAAGQ